MKKILIAVCFLLSPLLANGQAGTNACPVSKCYYVAATGADTNTGLTESVPWLHAPGMPNCTGVCASTTITAGQGIVFRGGDTWHFGNSALSPYTGSSTSCGGAATTCSWVWTVAGTAANCTLATTTSCTYLGIDITWWNSAVCTTSGTFVTGTNFCRPIMNLDNPIIANTASPDPSFPGYILSCPFDDSTYAGLVVNTNNVQVDGFEFVGKCWTQPGSSSSGFGLDHPSEMADLGSNTNQFSRLYVHGWTVAHKTPPAIGTNFMNKAPMIGAPNATFRISYSVFDGSDSTCTGSGNCTGGMITDAISWFDHNVARRLGNNISAPLQELGAVHDNLFENSYASFDSNSHSDENFVYANTAPAGTALRFYNNMSRNTLLGQNVNETKAQGASFVYVFNNIFFGIGNPQNCMIFSSADTTAGSYYMVNNTFDAPCPTVAPAGANGQPNKATGTVFVQNEHWVGFTGSSGANPTWSTGNGAPVTISDLGNDIAQTEAVANGQGYTTSNSYQPTSSSNATIHSGANLSSQCATFSADSALCFGSTGGVINTVGLGNVPVPLIANPTARGTTWDSGAYQFSGSAPPASTPTFNPLAGTYTGSQLITISTTTSGAVICFNTTGAPATNGTTGCAAGTLYTTPVSVPVSETLYAVAGGTGLTDSTVGSAAYVIKIQAATPTFSPAAGIYFGQQLIQISTTSGSLICYNITGSPGPINGASTCPANSTIYTGTVTVPVGSETIYAVAGGVGYTDSTVGSASYIVHPVELWSNILDWTRAVDWTAAGVSGGIPVRTSIFATVIPSGDTTGATDANNIETQVKLCPANQVVLLTTGTYYFNAGLFMGTRATGVPPNPCTLRGAGPNLTKMIFTGEVGCGNQTDICVEGGTGSVTNYSGATSWVGDNGTSGTYTKGDTILTIGSWTGTPPVVGDLITMDQRNDSIGACPVSGGTGNCSGVSGATESSTTVTMITSLPHGLIVGQCVGIGNIGGSESTTAYNSAGNTGSSCTSSSGTFTGWFSVTDIGCIVAGAYTTSASCTSSNPIIAFQYTAPSSGLAASGGTGLGVQANVTADTGGVFVSDVFGATIGDVGTIGRPCPSTNIGAGGGPECATGEISLRSQQEHKIITACNGSSVLGTSCAAAVTLTVDPPIEMNNWRTAQNPGIWVTGHPATGIGLEGFSYDMTGSNGGVADSARTGIHFANTVNSWVKNVRGINAQRNHVWLVNSARINVIDSYFFGTHSAAATSYGIEANTTSDNVIQNNICQHIPACLMSADVNGTVFSYNYSIDSGDGNPVNFLYPMITENHDFARMNLYEGNDSPAIFADDTHGNGSAQTTFRSRVVGQDYPTKTLASIQSMYLRAFNRGFNAVGNILGSVGLYTGGYQSSTVPTPQQYIWDIGQVRLIGPSGAASDTSNDLILRSTLLRWGNYDTFTAAVRWCGNSSSPGWATTCSSTSEIPTTAATYINANNVPTSTVLPSSFYLSAQPNWFTTTWGTPAFPPIGPDVVATGTLNATCGGTKTACDGVGNFSYQIPAQVCYNNTSIDSAYQLTFTVTNATWTSGAATLTIGANTLAASNTITVTGITPSGYNGVYQVSSATATTVTYAVSSNPGTYISGGSLTWPNLLLYSAAACYPQAYPAKAPAPSSILFTKLSFPKGTK